MSVYLDVPFVSQLNYGNGSMNDPTGCWYCSACMVAYHFESGPRQGVPELHTGSLTGSQRYALRKYLKKQGAANRDVNRGHAATGSTRAAGALKILGITDKTEHDLLAERENLRAVPKCASAHAFSLKDLEELLRNHGPIFFYWQKAHGGSTYGHASVIIGVEDRGSEVIFHDPENAPNSRMSLADFNSNRQQWKHAMMQRKGIISSSVRIKASGKASPAGKP